MPFHRIEKDKQIGRRHHNVSRLTTDITDGSHTGQHKG